MKYDMIEFGSLLIGSTRNGISKPKSIRGIGIPMIRMGELFRYDRIPELRELELVPLTDSEKDKFLLKKFDLLFARRSLTLQGAGKCSIYIGPENTTTFESSIIRARIDPNKANPLFYYYYFQSSLGKALISSIAEQVAVAGIRGSDLIRLKVHYFDRRTQDKISNILSILDSKIELNNKIIFNLEQLAQTLFKRWFVDFEFPNENGEPYKSSGGKMVQSELGEIPEGWEVGSLSSLASVSSGKRPKFKVDKKSRLANIPIIGASKIMGYTNAFLYDKPIIVTGRVGTHGVIQKVKFPCWPSDNTLVIESEYLEYCYQVLQTVDFASLNRGSTQPLITQTDIRNLRVLIPPLNYLKEFENKQSNISDLIEKKQVENEKLTNLRDTLLPRLLFGEIKLPDESEVTEHVLV